MAEFNSPEANAQFNRAVAKFRKNADAKTMAALLVLLKEGRDTVGWRSVGRTLIGGGE